MIAPALQELIDEARLIESCQADAKTDDERGHLADELADVHRRIRDAVNPREDITT